MHVTLVHVQVKPEHVAAFITATLPQEGGAAPKKPAAKKTTRKTAGGRAKTKRAARPRQHAAE